MGNTFFANNLRLCDILRSNRHVNEAMQIRSKDRVIGAPKIKAGHPISEELRFSLRFCGRSHLVLPARRERCHAQSPKPICLLLNLRELHEEWEKKVLLKVRILFVNRSAPATQRFVRPKRHAHSLRGHSFGQTTEELLSPIVCNIKNENGMCSCCPVNKGALLSILGSALDMDKVQDIHAETWITGVCCIPEEIVVSSFKFLEQFLGTVEDPKMQHLISKQEAKFLQEIETSRKMRGRMFL